MKNNMDWNEIETTLTQLFEKAVKGGDTEGALQLTDVIASVGTKKYELRSAEATLREIGSLWGDR